MLPCRALLLHSSRLRLSRGERRVSLISYPNRKGYAFHNFPNLLSFNISRPQTAALQPWYLDLGGFKNKIKKNTANIRLDKGDTVQPGRCPCIAMDDKSPEGARSRGRCVRDGQEEYFASLTWLTKIFGLGCSECGRRAANLCKARREKKSPVSVTPVLCSASFIWATLQAFETPDSHKTFEGQVPSLLE